jgi:hypothetical protein
MKTSGKGGGRVVDQDDEATGSPSVRGPGVVGPMPSARTLNNEDALDQRY